MEQALPYIGKKSLLDLTLPGTHDSGSYNLTKSILKGDSGWTRAAIEIGEELGMPVEKVISAWAIAQDHNVYEQLKGGMRYLDLRIGWDDATQQWRAWHMELGRPFKEILKHIRSFLKEHQKEILIIELDTETKHVGKKEQAELLATLDHYLGSYLLPE